VKGCFSKKITQAYSVNAVVVEQDINQGQNVKGNINIEMFKLWKIYNTTKR
jgi:hypothetical protein